MVVIRMWQDFTAWLVLRRAGLRVAVGVVVCQAAGLVATVPALQA